MFPDQCKYCTTSMWCRVCPIYAMFGGCRWSSWASQNCKKSCDTCPGNSLRTHLLNLNLLITYQSKLFNNVQHFNSFQWTASGKIGTNGAIAASHVVVARRPENGKKHKKLLMEGKSVQDQLKRTKNAKLMPAQVRM